MAQFIQVSPEELQEGEEFSPIEEEQIPEEEQPAEPEEIQEAAEEEVIPEKYQNKSIQDIVQMHQEAEKLLGRQSSEVGELRKVVDEFVKTKLEEAKSPQEEDEEIDFFDDPQKAVERAIAKHPKIKEAEQLSASMRQQEALSRLQTNHPDYSTIVQDTGFADWVMKSKFRVELFQRADQQFDYDAADELLTSWKERQNIVNETAQIQEADRKRQLKAASTGNAKGSSEKPSRKVYRRADIIKLMQTDPNRYQELAAEIRQAYAEGRVK